MTLFSAPDLIVDRRLLRRQLTFWRVIAVLVALAAVLGAGLMLGGGRLSSVQAHIARVEIEGLITGKQETLDVLREVENSRASALILRINSGGGTTSGSEALYRAVRRIAEKKPVIAVIDGIGASGAYMTALGADRILANGSALVGSIGVIAQFPNFSKLLDTLGVKVEAVRSSPLKAMPSGVEPTPPEARAALEETILETYGWFKALVGERRKLEGPALMHVADGRIFTGRMAVDLKLVDATGNEDDALLWLEAEKNIRKDTPVVDYKPRDKARSFGGFTALVRAGFFAAGSLIGTGQAVEDMAKAMVGTNAPEGMISLWQP